MKEIALKINAGITALLLGAVLLCLAFAVEGDSPLQEWVGYAWVALCGEAAVWLGIGVGAVINYFASLPPMRRGVRMRISTMLPIKLHGLVLC